MAPELIKGERKYSTSIDIWSFGIFAFELANVDPPNAQYRDQQKVLLKILNDEMPPLKSKWSENFKDFVSQCLIKDEKTRPTAEKLLQHAFLNGAD
jgi:serine/threonine-protein kinase 24/25/MST4